MKHPLITTAVLTATSLSAALVSCEKAETYTVQVAHYLGGRIAAVSLTYDDGMLCHYTQVAPQLEARGLRGTFWIIGSNMGTDSPDYPWMTWEQVADLARRGHEISNHSWTHPNLTELTEEQLRQEIVRCDTVIESVTGRRPRTFCYPYNAMSDDVVAICSEGRVGTRTFQAAHGETVSQVTPDTLRLWLDALIAEREWGVTMTHGTDYGWDLWIHPEWLWDFYDQLKAHENEVWVAPFEEVAAYRAERDSVSLLLTQDGHEIRLESTLGLDLSLFDQPLTAVINGRYWRERNVEATQGDAVCPILAGDSCLYVDFLPGREPVNIRW